MSITYKPGKKPHPNEHRLIFKNVDRRGWNPSIKRYLKEDGYKTLKKALEMDPKDVINEVKTSGLRGRGGAGFPTGIKWGFIPPNNTKPVYLICNCDESEPGTFKDRYIVHQDPHQLIEGMVISAHAVGAHTAYIYIREEFPEAAITLEKAIQEAKDNNFLGENILGSGFDLEIYIHRGAAAYICGEETGLIESLEGKRGWPRIKPPFPAVEGLFRQPTVVNNVETLCCVPHIINNGAEWFTNIGPEHSTGPKLFCISGPVKKPGCYEAPMDITIRDLIEREDMGGGMIDGKRVKGVLPGGASMGILSADELDMKMDFNDPRNYGLLGLGTAAAKWRLRCFLKPIDADDGLIAVLDPPKAIELGSNETLLDPAGINRSNDPTLLENLFEFGFRCGGNLLDLRFDHGGTLENIAVFKDVGLERKHLLNSQTPLLVPGTRET